MIDIGSPSDFAEGTVTLTQVGQQEIGVIRWAGTLYAVRNVCPHQSGPICSGQLLPLLTAPQAGTSGLMRDSSRPVLSCPWHAWEFDLQSGRALWNDRYRVRTYPIEVRDGRVLVDTKRHAEPRFA